MQKEIKCLKCGKRTLRFEMGRAFVNTDKRKIRVLIESPVICPKCGADISSKQFALKEKEFFFTIVAASMTPEEKRPKHLKGIMKVNERQYREAEKFCKSVSILLDRF